MISRRRRRRRDRGFSLIIVFLLMVIMTGTAIGVLTAAQADLNLAGVGREQQIALYAAEYAVARAKSLIASQTTPMYSSSSGWNGLLQTTIPAVAVQLCDPSSAATVNSMPGTLPLPANALATFYTMTDRSGATLTGQNIQWRYCLHNDASDPGYLAPTGAPNGNTDDSRDPQHFIVIEAYGTAPNGAASHLTVMVGSPILNSTTSANSYAQEGSGSAHTGTGGATEAGITIGSGAVTY